MNDKEKWWERLWDICATSTTWWWWYIYIYIPSLIYVRLFKSIHLFPYIFFLFFLFVFFFFPIFSFLYFGAIFWTPTHGRAKAGRPARTYIQQLCEDTGCCPEDLPRAMNDREEWRKRVRDIRAASRIWWWWWWYTERKTNNSTYKNKICFFAFSFITTCTMKWS